MQPVTLVTKAKTSRRRLNVEQHLFTLLGSEPFGCIVKDPKTIVTTSLEKAVVIVAQNVDLFLSVDGFYYIPSLAAHELQLFIRKCQTNEVFIAKSVHDSELSLCFEKELECRCVEVVDGTFDVLGNHGIETNELDKVGMSFKHELFGWQPRVVEACVFTSDCKDALINLLVD
jgi:hypothetical protein